MHWTDRLLVDEKALLGRDRNIDILLYRLADDRESLELALTNQTTHPIEKAVVVSGELLDDLQGLKGRRLSDCPHPKQDLRPVEPDGDKIPKVWCGHCDDRILATELTLVVREEDIHA